MKKKPIDTNTYHYYNANPHNKKGDDCVVRALCTVLNQSWEQTVRELTELGIKYGYVLNDRHTYEIYLKEKGWVKQKQPRKEDNTRYTGIEFCTMYNDINCIAHIGTHHIIAIINGKIHDIWNCSEYCIGNFWIKQTT